MEAFRSPALACGVAAGLALFAAWLLSAPAADAAKLGDKGLERSLRAHLKKHENLNPTKISRCGPRQGHRVYSCRWKAEGLFPGEVPYRCSGKARYTAPKKRWRVGKCKNQLPPMVPLLPELGPHPAFGYNDDWSDADHNVRISLLPAGGATVARWPVRWDHVQPGPNTFNWVEHDYVRQLFRQYGIQPLIVISGAPCWAQAGDCVHGGHPAPEHYPAMATFAAQVAQRYTDAIGIEVWNEPNLTKFWGGEPDPAAYGQLLTHVAPAIHQANPAMPVVTAGLAPQRASDENGDPVADFLSAAYATGGPQLADAIGAHPYPFRAYPEDFLGAIRTELHHYVSVMGAHGDAAKPIWVTETGVANDEGYSLDQQADALARMYALFRRIANLPVVIFHRFVDRESASDKERSYGVLRSNGNAKPAFCAVAAAREVPC